MAEEKFIVNLRNNYIKRMPAKFFKVIAKKARLI